jgi:hypothetical protein
MCSENTNHVCAFRFHIYPVKFSVGVFEIICILAFLPEPNLADGVSEVFLERNPLGLE